MKPSQKRELDRLDFQAKKAIIRDHYEKFEYACLKIAIMNGTEIHPKFIKDLWTKKRKEFLDKVTEIKKDLQ